MITFEEIDVDEAMLQIFKTKNFPILKLHIEDEVNNIDGNIVYEYLNGKDLSGNIYTNNDTLSIITNPYVSQISFNRQSGELTIVRTQADYWAGSSAKVILIRAFS